MIGNDAQAGEQIQMLNSASAANTAAATSAWFDVSKYEGTLVFLINPGAITGSCTPSFEDATDGAGAGAAAILPNEALSALVANTARKYTMPAGKPRGWVRFIGTIVTGPSLIGVQLFATPKYA